MVFGQKKNCGDARWDKGAKEGGKAKILGFVSQGVLERYCCISSSHDQT